MKKESNSGISFFQRYLTVWVIVCMLIGIMLGHFFSGNERGTEPSGICRNFYSDGSSYMDYDLSNDDEG